MVHHKHVFRICTNHSILDYIRFETFHSSAHDKVITFFFAKNKDITGVCVRAMCAVGVRGSEKYPTEFD